MSGGRGRAIAAGILALSVGLVASVRSTLFETEKTIRNEHDVYFLPPPEQVVTMSLGYRAALADVLWAHVLVSQGLHSFEQRRFENLVLLYDAIYALAPTWRTPYLLADALITFQANTTPFEEVLKVREILERGIEERPYDAEIWLNLGQFVSFVAPSSYLEPDHMELAAQWRLEGVEYLARAAELGAAESSISWQALGGAVILQREGETGQAVRFLQNTYMMTDDPELRADIERRLESIEGQRKTSLQTLAQLEFRAYQERDIEFTATTTALVPFMSRDLALALMPPPFDAAACAGPGHLDEPTCAISWRTWGDRMRPRIEARLSAARRMARKPSTARPDDGAATP